MTMRILDFIMGFALAVAIWFNVAVFKEHKRGVDAVVSQFQTCEDFNRNWNVQ